MTDLISNPQDLSALLADLPVMDKAASKAARARQDQLTKPAGSLGRLEDIAVWLAGCQGKETPQAENIKAVIFAGNHGVTRHGVSAFPAEVTAQMVANYSAGGAAINQLCVTFGAELNVIPIDLDRPTGDITIEPAMSEQDMIAAFNIGAHAVSPETDILVLGEMGIGNTTVAALLSALCFDGQGVDWAGPGTGIDTEAIKHKAGIIDQALAQHRKTAVNPFEILRSAGGRELAAIAGAVLSARLKRVPVLLDGFVCCAAASPLMLGASSALDHCLAGHVSAEPGHKKLLEALKMKPLLNLNMRLGEASGAALALGILKAAVNVHNGMATFEEAGVSTRDP